MFCTYGGARALSALELVSLMRTFPAPPRRFLGCLSKSDDVVVRLDLPVSSRVPGVDKLAIVLEQSPAFGVPELQGGCRRILACG